MNKTEFQSFLIENNFEELQVNQLLNYKDLIQQYNKLHNLTRLDNENLVYDIFFVESILPFIKINFNPSANKSLIDIGSGNGNPGIILKILYPKLNVTLLEANSKKCEILNEIIDKLGISITVLNGRAEEIIKEKQLYESYDYVTSRAVAKLINLLEISIGFAKINGFLIEPKGIKAIDELNEAKLFCAENNIKLINSISYNYNNKANTIFVFEKLKETNNNIPRS